MIRLNDKAIAVEVLKGSVDHEIYDGSFYYVSDESYYDSPSADKRYKIDLPEGNWQILGLAHELNEGQCTEVVDIGILSAKESFRLLMQSRGLDMKVKTYLILTKND